MSFFKAECPVRPDEQTWIEEQTRWLRSEFGEHALTRHIVLPSDDFFPGVYHGTPEDVRDVVELVRKHMDVPAGSFVVELADTDATDNSAIDELVGYRTTSGAAGEYRSIDGSGLISLSMTQAKAPMALVATIAHEFCHHRLIGEGRVESSRPDNEPLTDLATVFFGFGIFAANAALDFNTSSHLRSTGEKMTGWRTSRLGYLTEPMFGYALAYWAHLRDDPNASWSAYVDTNPRAFLKRGLRYLKSR